MKKLTKKTALCFALMGAMCVPVFALPQVQEKSDNVKISIGPGVLLGIPDIKIEVDTKKAPAPKPVTIKTKPAEKQLVHKKNEPKPQVKPYPVSHKELKHHHCPICDRHNKTPAHKKPAPPKPVCPRW